MSNQLKLLFTGIAGILLMAAAYFLLNNSHASQLLAPSRSPAEINSVADGLFKKNQQFESAFRRETKFNLNNVLFVILQTHQEHISDNANARVGVWNVEYYGVGEQEDQFLIEYWIDATGKNIGFAYSDDYTPQDTLRRLTARAADSLARAYLSNLQGDMQSWETTANTESERKGMQIRTVEFERPWPHLPHTKQRLSVRFSAGEVTRLNPFLSIDEDAFEASWRGPLDISIVVIGGTLWFGLSIFFIILFFRRLQREELDAAKARTIAAFAFIAMWAVVAAAAWGEWIGVVVGGGFAGLFFGLYILIISGLTESLTREMASEKIHLSDYLLRGKLMIREAGHALFNSLWVAGGAIFLAVLVTWLANANGWLAYSFDDDDFWVFSEINTLIGRLFADVTTGLIQTLTILGCTALLIIYKWGNSRLSKTLQTVAFALMTFQFMALSPYVVAVPLYLVVAAWFIHCNYKFDLVTMLLAMTLFSLGQDFLQLGFVGGNGTMRYLLYWIVPLSIVFLPLGLWLTAHGTPLSELATFIPEYVHRIREKERQARELEIARGIQQQFLPPGSPAFNGLDIAGICRPAMEVGGDYFDFVAHGQNKYTIIIGDVSGKGVSAAFYMTMTKGIIKTLARSRNGPAEILIGLNEVFYENSPRNIFISVLLGTIDLEAGTLTFARAGHNPLLVRRSKQQDPRYLNPVGIAIGMDRGPIFEKSIREETIPVTPGDLFVFYTDGVSEAMNTRREEYGEERLADLINQLSSLSAAQILDRMQQEIDGFAGEQPQHDDFTVVVVKVDGNKKQADNRA